MVSMFRSASDASAFGCSARLAELAAHLPVGRESTNLDPPLTEREWDALCALIGCSPEVRAGMADPIEMRRWPLFVLTKKEVLRGVVGHAFDELRVAFESLASQDPEVFGRYKDRRGEWHHAQVVSGLKRVFPSDIVFESLTYPDPDKPAGHTAELDAAVWWDPFLILVEAKSGQFRLESQLGDVGRLRTDLSNNVADAFRQARRAARYVQSIDEARFVEKGSGRRMLIKRRDVRRTFLITVSLRHLANVATYLACARPLKLFTGTEYPWAVSLADLENIVEYSEGPDIFLHYIERRLAIQQEPTEVIGDELHLFGAYLKTRLPESMFVEEQGQRFTHVQFADSHLMFDEAMEYRRGERPTAPEISLAVPPSVSAILAELRRGEKDPQARWIAHCLLSFGDEHLAALHHIFVTARERRPSAGRFGRAVYSVNNCVICAVTTTDHPPHVLRDQAKYVAVIEKYRRKADLVACFAIDLRESKAPFQTALWVEGKWQYDPPLDRLVQEESAGRLT